MTQNLSQQAKGMMSPIDGPVHRQPGRLRAKSGLPLHKYLQNLFFFLNVEDEEVFHHYSIYFFSEDRNYGFWGTIYTLC